MNFGGTVTVDFSYKHATLRADGAGQITVAGTPAVEFIPLGGIGEFGMNMHLLVCGDTALLFDAGVLPELGSVDAGTTRTDSMELERRRGITIRAAVTSFALDGMTVNLLDTTPEVAEVPPEAVDRALAALGGFARW